MTQKDIEQLKAQMALYTIEHITGKRMHKGIAWLRDSFNKECEAMGIPTPHEPNGYDCEDIIETLEEEPWVKDIAAKPADIRTQDDTDRIVNDFFYKHWMVRPKEVTSKDVARLLNFVDPYSHRHVVGQKVSIDCIHALDKDQLERLDGILRDLEKNPQISYIQSIS